MAHPALLHHSLPLLAVVALALLSGCSMQVYQPSRHAGFQLDPAYEINDEDVQKAMTARPQLPPEVNVAYFAFAPDKDDLTLMIERSPHVTNSYRIPALLVTGERRFDSDARAHHRHGPPAETKPPSIKKLRLLAARAQADVLVLFDYGYRRRSSPNAWAISGILLFPMLFAPMADYEVESYLDAYVIDVRNGYLYAQISSSLEDEAPTESLLSDVAEELTEAQWAKLRGATGDKLERLFAASSNHQAPSGAAATVAAP